MNADVLEGKWGQFKGELKRQWGKFPDDDLMEIEGNYEKLLGKLPERYGERKDEISGWADNMVSAQQAGSDRKGAASLGGLEG